MHGQRFSHGVTYTGKLIHDADALSATHGHTKSPRGDLCGYLLRAVTAGIKTENDFGTCRSQFGIRIFCLRNCRQHLRIFLRSSKRVASRGILRKRIKEYRTKNVKFCLIQRECAGEKTGKSGKCAKQVNKIAQKIKNFCESPCYLWLGVL